MSAVSAFDDEVVREALRQVEDPEAGMNIVDLGLVYGVELAAGTVHIDLTMTTAACPMTDMIVAEVRSAVGVNVRLVWDPPWTSERMSGIAREHFGWTY